MPAERRTNVVLCIDDNEDVLQLLEMFLHDRAYRVLTASTGARGLELAALDHADVVVLDYEMPGMNGHQVAVALRRRQTHIPIVMFSGAVDIPRETLELVDAFVPKSGLSGYSTLALLIASLSPMPTPGVQLKSQSLGGLPLFI